MQVYKYDENPAIGLHMLGQDKMWMKPRFEQKNDFPGVLAFCQTKAQVVLTEHARQMSQWWGWVQDTRTGAGDRTLLATVGVVGGDGAK